MSERCQTRDPLRRTRAAGAHPWGLLRRAGPLSLLLASFVLMAGGLLIEDLTAGLVGIAVLFLGTVVLAGPSGISWPRLVPAAVAFASLTWSNWLLAGDRDLERALVAGLRVAFFVAPGIVFVGFLDPSTLGDHLAQRLRWPARPVIAAVSALQRLDTLIEDWATLNRTRRIRGLTPGRNPVAQVRHYAGMTFALLVEALRQAQVLATAMEARGYGRLARRGHARTWAGPAPWTRADTALIVVSVALAAVPSVVQLVR